MENSNVRFNLRVQGAFQSAPLWVVLEATSARLASLRASEESHEGLSNNVAGGFDGPERLYQGTNC